MLGARLLHGKNLYRYMKLSARYIYIYIYSDSDSDSVTPPTGLSGEFGHTCSTGARG